MSIPSFLPKMQPLLFGLPRFATMFFYIALVTLSLPLIVVDHAGEYNKGLHLGLITGGAALLSVGFLYVFGIYRDRKRRTYQGVRYPLYGLALSLPALVLISASEYYSVLVIAFFILIISRSFCESSHLSVLTDMPDLKDRGHYTAGITFWHFLGSGLGALSFGFLSKSSDYFGLRLSSGLGIISSLIVLVSIVIFYTIFFRPRKRERLVPEQREQVIRFELPKSLKYLIFARFFFLSGILIISTFLVFVVRDYIAADEIKKNHGPFIRLVHCRRDNLGPACRKTPETKRRDSGSLFFRDIPGNGIRRVFLIRPEVPGDQHTMHDPLWRRFRGDHIFRTFVNRKAHSPSANVGTDHGNRRFQYFSRPVSRVNIRGLVP